MRPLVLVLTVLASGLAQAQQPLDPMAPQADDREVPPSTPPPAAPVVAPPASAPVLLTPFAPAGYQYKIVDSPPRLERRWGLFTAGIVTFGGVWMANLQAGIPTGQFFLDIPLLGPLLEISLFTNRDYASYGQSSGERAVEGWMIFLLVTDAAVQIGGFAMMIAGATTKRSRPGGQSFQLVPLGAGAALRGSF